MRYAKTIDGQTVIRDASRIVIRKDGSQIINPGEALILADGWLPYTPPVVEPTPNEPTESDLLFEFVKKSYNERTDVANEEALRFQLVVYPFDHYVGGSLRAGQLVTHEERIYRVRQDVPVVLAEQYPSTDTAALFEVIEKEHSGEVDDPIPYTPPMEVFLGKYYEQDGALYICTRDSGVALTHNLADLVGSYFNRE